MCKYCEGFFKWDEQCEKILEAEIKIGEHTVGYATNFLEYDTKQAKPILKICLEDVHAIPLAQNHIQVHYCPVCGSKLESM